MSYHSSTSSVFLNHLTLYIWDLKNFKCVCAGTLGLELIQVELSLYQVIKLPLDTGLEVTLRSSGKAENTLNLWTISVLLHIVHWDSVSNWTWSLLIPLAGLVSELQGSSYPSLPSHSAEPISFTWGSKRLNSVTSTLITGLSLQL